MNFVTLTLWMILINLLCICTDLIIFKPNSLVKSLYRYANLSNLINRSTYNLVLIDVVCSKTSNPPSVSYNKGGVNRVEAACTRTCLPSSTPPPPPKLNNNTKFFTYYNMKNCDRIKTHIQGHDYFVEETTSVAYESTTLPSKPTSPELYPQNPQPPKPAFRIHNSWNFVIWITNCGTSPSEYTQSPRLRYPNYQHWNLVYSDTPS